MYDFTRRNNKFLHIPYLDVNKRPPVFYLSIGNTGYSLEEVRNFQKPNIRVDLT